MKPNNYSGQNDLTMMFGFYEIVANLFNKSGLNRFLMIISHM